MAGPLLPRYPSLESPSVSVDALSLIRREWEDGNRRLEAERSDPRRYRTLVHQVELVVDELRKQVGAFLEPVDTAVLR